MTSSTATGVEERVARAICRKFLLSRGARGMLLEGSVEADWRAWLGFARAALAAIPPDAAEQTGGAE